MYLKKSTFPMVNGYIGRIMTRCCLLFLIMLVVASGCAPQTKTSAPLPLLPSATPISDAAVRTGRPQYSPGELVDYIAQTGDTLPALAAHFNTTIGEIQEANPDMPQNVTTLPPGYPMKIPIYYQPLWGSSFQILPDQLFINGPQEIGFDAVTFVNEQPGWLKDYIGFPGGSPLKGGEIINYVATNFSISPRLLLALIEFQVKGLSSVTPPPSDEPYVLGLNSRDHQGLYRQLVLAANILNNGYYGWRTGLITEFDLRDGSLEQIDPWQNAATAGLHYYFASALEVPDYYIAVESDGFYLTYTQLFGDPWLNHEYHIPGSLEQPPMRLPFETLKSWSFTGGPHTGWGEGLPFAAIDFAPPSVVGGCTPSNEWVTAVADGVIARVGNASLVLDLDGDGDERTGWVVFYLHLSSNDLPSVGQVISAGQPIGHPSCEGGRATGTHVHIARKYNGEWISADSALPFNLEGWVAGNGDDAYQGTLTRNGTVIRACLCSDKASQIQAGSISQ